MQLSLVIKELKTKFKGKYFSFINVAKGKRCTIARVGKDVKTPHSLHTLSMNANRFCHYGNARAVLPTSHLEIWCQRDALHLALSKGAESRCQHKDFNADVRIATSLFPRQWGAPNIQQATHQYTNCYMAMQCYII